MLGEVDEHMRKRVAQNIPEVLQELYKTIFEKVKTHCVGRSVAGT